MIEHFQNSDFSWHHLAECDGIDDPDIFYPPRDKAVYKEIATKAKSYCFGDGNTLPCPVRTSCLWEAVRTDEQHGIWGGLSHRERNALVRKWNKKFRNKMSLKDYIFSLEKGPQNESKSKKVL